MKSGKVAQELMLRNGQAAYLVPSGVLVRTVRKSGYSLWVKLSLPADLRARLFECPDEVKGTVAALVARQLGEPA